MIEVDEMLANPMAAILHCPSCNKVVAMRSDVGGEGGEARVNGFGTSVAKLIVEHHAASPMCAPEDVLWISVVWDPLTREVKAHATTRFPPDLPSRPDGGHRQQA